MDSWPSFVPQQSEANHREEVRVVHRDDSLQEANGTWQHTRCQLPAHLSIILNQNHNRAHVCVCVCCTVFDLLDVFDSHDADGNGVVQIDDRIPATGGIEAQTGNSAVAFRKFHGGSGWFQWTNDLAAAPRQIAANLVAAASVSWSGIVVVSVIVVSSSPSSSRKYRLKSSFPLNQIDLERNGIVGCHGFNPMIQKDPALRGQLSKAGDTFGVSRRQSNVLFIQMDHSLHFQTRNVMNQGV